MEICNKNTCGKMWNDFENVVNNSNAHEQQTVKTKKGHSHSKLFLEKKKKTESTTKVQEEKYKKYQKTRKSNKKAKINKYKKKKCKL